MRSEVALPAEGDTEPASGAAWARVKLESMGAFKQEEILRAGQFAPEFKLERLEDGGASRIANRSELLRDGPVLLAFFKSSCPVCQMTLPFLERVHRGRTPGSMNIYGVSQDDAETTGEFAAKFGISFPLLLDSAANDYAAGNAYGISHVPTMFWWRGTVLSHGAGRVSSRGSSWPWRAGRGGTVRGGRECAGMEGGLRL